MKRLGLLLGVVLGLCGALFAGDNPPALKQVTPERDWGDSFELELMIGLAGAPISGNHISYHYTDTELRLGWMLYPPHGSGLLRGNVEILADLGGGGIWEGPGSAFGSLGGTLRYNFVQPSARIVPYFQIGAAAFASDISENRRQQDVGGPLEAELNSGVGLKFLTSPRWSFNTELFFEHVSNANTQTHNVGINALGGLLGISRSF